MRDRVLTGLEERQGVRITPEEWRDRARLTARLEAAELRAKDAEGIAVQAARDLVEARRSAESWQTGTFAIGLVVVAAVALMWFLRETEQAMLGGMFLCGLAVGAAVVGGMWAAHRGR